MPRIVAVETALPAHYYSQDQLAAALLALSARAGKALDPAKVERFFAAVSVGGRHLALPLEAYASLDGFAQRNAAWLEAALHLGERAVRGALARSGVAPADVGLFATSTVTGVSVPSLDARLMNRVKLASDCRRLPLFGLGCVAGAAGIARVHDYLRAYPKQAALFLCAELCSLTLQPDDVSVTNVIASGLFGDGAAAVVMVGDEHPLAARGGHPGVVETRSVFFPNTERIMGWDIVDTGFRIVLSSGVPELARTALAGGIRSFLSERGLGLDAVREWIAHPGGPAVIDAMEKGLELPRGTLDASRTCLARIGNLSSVSVLVLLAESLARPAPRAGSHGLLLAMGPGFCAELVLLRWS